MPRGGAGIEADGVEFWQVEWERGGHLDELRRHLCAKMSPQPFGNPIPGPVLHGHDARRPKPQPACQFGAAHDVAEGIARAKLAAGELRSFGCRICKCDDLVDNFSHTQHIKHRHDGFLPTPFFRR